MTVEADGSESEHDEDIDEESEDEQSEEVDEELDDDESEGDDDEDDEDDLVERVVDALESRLESRFDSIADRRVNALLKEIRKQGSGSQSEKPKKSESSGRSGGDVRAARLAAREYLSDEIDKFVSADERKQAMDLVALEVEVAVGRGDDDEDEIGREVAQRVAERVRSARKMYGDKTRSDLKRRGALKDKDGQPKKGGGGTSPQSQLSKGAEIAQRIRPTSQ